jgi:hypothetical protein
MRRYHNLLHLLHQSLRFDSLIIKFLDQLIDLLPVAYADKLIKNIYKVFFHQVEWDVMRLSVAAATWRLWCRGWSPSIWLVVASGSHCPELKMLIRTAPLINIPLYK